jgi:hypothetical protein
VRADLAPFALDFVLALAGLGILVATRVVPPRLTHLAGAFGLAYLTGAALVPLALTILLVIGVPFTLETFAVVALLCIAVGVWLGRRWRITERPPTGTPWWRRPWRSWPVDVWVVAGFAVGFGIFAVVGLLDAFRVPLLGWDAWGFYTRKAQMLTWHDSLFHEFFASPNYFFIHPDYPLQLPLFEALHFRAAGNVDSQAVMRHLWLLLVGFVWGAAYLLRKRVRPVVWAPLLLLAALAPGVWEQLLTGFADVPMAMFAGMGAIALALWLSEGRAGRPYLVLGAVMLAAAANTKNEGLMVAVALLVVAGIFALVRGLPRREFLIAAGTAIAVQLPWRIWMSANGVETEFSLSKGLNPSYLAHHASRVWPSIRTLGHELSDQSRWLYLLPLAVMVVLAALISGAGRRVAAFYATAFAVVCAGFVWNYWATVWPIGWYLETSASRIITVLVFICIAAVVHVSGLLLNALLKPPVGSGVDGDDGPDRDRGRPLGSRAPEGSPRPDGLDVRAVRG